MCGSLEVSTAGRGANGNASQLDYILCDRDIAPLIEDVRLEPVVPWAPHSALTFAVSRRPQDISIRKLKVPKNLCYAKDEQGALQRWAKSIHSATRSRPAVAHG